MDYKLAITKDCVLMTCCEPAGITAEDILLRTRQLMDNVNLRSLVVCGHYGCKHAVDSLQSMEDRVRRDVRLVTSAIAAITDDADSKVFITGCLYDPEFDWLSFYDSETDQFLPAEVVCGSTVSTDPEKIDN